MTKRRMIVGVTYGLLASLLVALPSPINAQFIPIEQAKEQEQTAQDTALTSVLTEINSKGASAKRQITALFDDVEDGKSTGSNAERKATTITEKLKSQLTDLLTAYTKKNPSGTSLRTAYDASQQMINDVRRQTDEGLDQAYLQKQENPTQLTGKYLIYEKKIKVLVEKGLKKADDRLNERGAKDTVKKDLQAIIADTEEQVEIATSSFLSVNTTVLASAVQRVKKSVMDGFGADMATRFKKAEERGSDKALDLTEEEQEQITALITEAAAAVDRALQTTEQLTQQIATSNLPTTSSVPGVNPLLEAKFKAQKQITEIQETTLTRLDKINQRYQAKTDASTLAKEVVAREIASQKNRMKDYGTEYLEYFSAGDPTRQQYAKAKKNAQDEAEGCSSFLCDIGRVASGVARGVIGKQTGIDIGSGGQQLISNGIFGIDDPNPYARSRYQTGLTSYTTLPGGVTASGGVTYDPTRCLVAAPTQRKVAFIERAQAQVESGDQGLGPDETGVGVPTSSTETPTDRSYVPGVTESDSNGTLNGQQLDGNKQPIRTYIPETGSYKPSGSTSPNTNKKSANSWVQFGLDLFNVNSRQQTQQQQGNFACNSYPNTAYSSPFSGTAVPSMLGYNSYNITPGFNSSNWQGMMQGMVTAASQTDPRLGQMLPYFNGGLTQGEMNRMYAFMNQNGHMNMPSDNPYWQMSYITRFMRELCSEILLSGNGSLNERCRAAWLQGTTSGYNTPPFNPNSPLVTYGFNTTGATNSRFTNPLSSSSYTIPNNDRNLASTGGSSFTTTQQPSGISTNSTTGFTTTSSTISTTAVSQIDKLKEQIDADIQAAFDIRRAPTKTIRCSALIFLVPDVEVVGKTDPAYMNKFYELYKAECGLSTGIRRT